MGPPVGRIGRLKCPLRARIPNVTQLTPMHSPRAFQITAENAKERKNINQQLLAFSRVVQEMSQANEGRGDSVASEVKLIPMRDSRPTQVLGPVMAENSGPVFLLALLPL